MAGGRGTRFWPRSRKSHSKQVLSFTGDRTLIQQTVDRLAQVLPPERIFVLTNPILRAEIVRQLPGVPKRQILAEPAQRNTAPAIGLAAHLIGQQDPDAVMGVFPADHVITKPARFLKFVRAAYQGASQGQVVVLGIQARWAETGYGYVEFPEGFAAGGTTPLRVLSFREKPKLADAEQYLASGRFCWNAGMFFWKTSVFTGALREFMPKTATLLAGLPKASARSFPAELARVFPLCENVSVDYGIMEKAKGITGLATDDIGWNDVGSWNAVYELLTRKAGDNVTRGESLAIDSRGNYVDAGGKLVALVGVENLVVVDTPDALLVTTRQQSQKVGEMVKLLERLQREDLL
ncbi:MAG: NTP transferase domain-containing protein [Bryobacteraceae bacterium]|nr:NTP transferase domain-containing protein [Bryobacteraceae bacterium]